MVSAKLFTLWLMGPTSGGKTTVAKALCDLLHKKNIPVMHYDGDEIRDLFGSSLGFEKEGRLKVVKTLVYFANKTGNAGMNVVVSALTANPDARRYVSGNINNLITCYVKCPIEVCAKRDPKGLYKKAQQGSIVTLIGFNSEYLPPDNPDITLDSDKCSPEVNAETIIEYLSCHGYIK